MISIAVIFGMLCIILDLICRQDHVLFHLTYVLFLRPSSFPEYCVRKISIIDSVILEIFFLFAYSKRYLSVPNYLLRI